MLAVFRMKKQELIDRMYFNSIFLKKKQRKPLLVFSVFGISPKYNFITKINKPVEHT